MRSRTPFVLLSTLLLVAVKKTYAEDKKNGKEGKDGNFEKAKKSAASIFAVEYLPIGHLRTDPILSQECLSDHVHTFYGPPMIHPSVSFEELRSTRNAHEATSGNVLENQSLYWHPAFYKQSGDGTKEILEPDWTTVYYAFRKGKTRAFPEGFRMISFAPNGLELACYNYGGNKTSSYDKDQKNENDFETTYFPSKPCEELAASFTFPSCWDGKNLGTEDPMSHVTYGIGLESGKLETFGYGGVQCPESHPVLLPQILLFIRFVNYTGELYQLSNGDGFDWHADYIMGWEEEFLQEIMDDCDDLKDIPCGSTRLREISGTGAKDKDESGKNPSDSWSAMGEALREVRVPMVNTTCITNESITKVESLPRGSCKGSILSPDSCNQPELPDEFLINGGAKESQSGSAAITTTISLTFSVMLVAVVLAASEN